MKLKIAAGAIAISFAVAGVVSTATQDPSTSENTQVFSQSKKRNSQEKPNGTAGSSFQRLGF